MEGVPSGARIDTAINCVLAETEREKGKKLYSLSPLSGAPRRIGAVAP